MQHIKENSLLRTVYRFHFIGKFFGVSCFRIKKDKQNRKFTEVTRYDIMVLVAFLVALTFVTYENYAYPQDVSLNENDRIFNVAAQILIGLSSVVCATGVFKAFLDREKFLAIIFDIMCIDKRVSFSCLKFY